MKIMLAFVRFIITFLAFFNSCFNVGRNVDASKNYCYRCFDGTNMMPNLTTYLRSADKVLCRLRSVECSVFQKICVFGYVSMQVRGQFRFFLSGCMNDYDDNYSVADRTIQCYRGSKTVTVGLYGTKVVMSANYCTCATELCNHKYFQSFVSHYNFSPETVVADGTLSAEHVKDVHIVSDSYAVPVFGSSSSGRQFYIPTLTLNFFPIFIFATVVILMVN